MVNKIQAGLLAGLLGSITLLGGVILSDDDVYYCADRSIVMKCDSLSIYYGLDNGKCNNTETGNKLCRTGWVEIDNSDEIILKTDSKQEICDTISCTPK